MELKTDAIRELHLALLKMENRHRHLLLINQLKSKWTAFLGHAYNGYFANALWVTQANPKEESFSKLLSSEIFPELNRTARENIELWKTMKKFFKCLDATYEGTDALSGAAAPIHYTIEPSLCKRLEDRQVHIIMPKQSLILPNSFHGVINYLMDINLKVLLSAMPSIGYILVTDGWENQKTYCLRFQVDPDLLDLEALNGYFIVEKENIDIIADNGMLEMALLSDLLLLLGAKLEKRQGPCLSSQEKDAVIGLTISLELPMPDS